MTSVALCAHREAESIVLPSVALIAPKVRICVVGIKTGFIIMFNRLDVGF